MCRMSWNLGASTCWKPQGLSRPVMGLLYLYSVIHRNIRITSKRGMKTYISQPLKCNYFMYKLVTFTFDLNIFRTDVQQQVGYFWYRCLFAFERQSKRITLHKNTCNMFQVVNISSRNLYNTYILISHLRICNTVSHLLSFVNHVPEVGHVGQNI
jgi:hypothetical protein